MKDDAMTLSEFLTEYDPNGTRTAAVIGAVPDSDGNSPFVVVRCGRYAAVLALIPVGSGEGSYLDIDVHPFVNDMEATAGVLGMTRGQSHRGLPVTGTRSGRWNSAGMVAVLIGEQGEVPVPDSALVQAAREAQALNEPVTVQEAGAALGIITGKLAVSTGPVVTSREGDEPLAPGPLPEELRVNGTVYVRFPD